MIFPINAHKVCDFVPNIRCWFYFSENFEIILRCQVLSGSVPPVLGGDALCTFFTLEKNLQINIRNYRVEFGIGYWLLYNIGNFIHLLHLRNSLKMVEYIVCLFLLVCLNNSMKLFILNNFTFLLLLKLCNDQTTHISEIYISEIKLKCNQININKISTLKWIICNYELLLEIFYI